MITIEDLFDEHGAISYEKQLRLADAVGNSSWRFDMADGVLRFDAFQTPVQILGTVSEEANTWLWAWANEESNIPPSLLTAVERLRAIGTELQVPEISEAEIDVIDFQKGHVLAMIAVGLLRGAAYYRGPYEGGAVFFLLPDLPIAGAPTGDTNLHVTTNFTSFICAHECDNRRALESYLRQKGYSLLSVSDRRIRAENKQEGPVEADFDSEGRLVSFESQIGGPRR